MEQQYPAATQEASLKPKEASLTLREALSDEETGTFGRGVTSCLRIEEEEEPVLTLPQRGSKEEDDFFRTWLDEEDEKEAAVITLATLNDLIQEKGGVPMLLDVFDKERSLLKKRQRDTFEEEDDVYRPLEQQTKRAQERIAKKRREVPLTLFQDLPTREDIIAAPSLAQRDALMRYVNLVELRNNHLQQAIMAAKVPFYHSIAAFMQTAHTVPHAFLDAKYLHAFMSDILDKSLEFAVQSTRAAIQFDMETTALLKKPFGVFGHEFLEKGKTLYKDYEEMKRISNHLST